jgi:hypothetical protein
MKLRLTLTREKVADGYLYTMDIAKMLGPEISHILFAAMIDEFDYRRLKPCEGVLYTEDSQALLKNWVADQTGNRGGLKNDKKTFAIDS